MPKAQKFLYGNGASSAPTAVELDRTLIRDLFFNVSPAKVFFEPRVLLRILCAVLLCSLANDSKNITTVKLAIIVVWLGSRTSEKGPYKSTSLFNQL